MVLLFGDRRLPLRFWQKARVATTGCWLWQAGKTKLGYGRYTVYIKSRLAYRVCYEHLVGPVPPGLELDHLCRVRHCVNPVHLEPITHRENMLRGDTVAAKHAAKTHCPVGHEYDTTNTYVDKKGSKHCRPCHARREAARRERINDDATTATNPRSTKK